MTQFNPKAVRILSALYRGQTVLLCGFNFILRGSEVCIRKTYTRPDGSIEEFVVPASIGLSEFLQACESLSEEEVLAAAGENSRYW